jgi:hypothetical protein
MLAIAPSFTTHPAGSASFCTCTHPSNVFPSNNEETVCARSARAAPAIATIHPRRVIPSRIVNHQELNFEPVVYHVVYLFVQLDASAPSAFFSRVGFAFLFPAFPLRFLCVSEPLRGNAHPTLKFLLDN